MVEYFNESVDYLVAIESKELWQQSPFILRQILPQTKTDYNHLTASK